MRLGWLHEYAYTGRPITAAFAGAPAAAFTVYGATPQRDAAVIGFSASTAVSDNASIYLRYDGDIGSGTDNHALNFGVRCFLVNVPGQDRAIASAGPPAIRGASSGCSWRAGGLLGMTASAPLTATARRIRSLS